MKKIRWLIGEKAGNDWSGWLNWREHNENLTIKIHSKMKSWMHVASGTKKAPIAKKLLLMPQKILDKEKGRLNCWNAYIILPNKTILNVICRFQHVHIDTICWKTQNINCYLYLCKNTQIDHQQLLFFFCVRIKVGLSNTSIWKSGPFRWFIDKVMILI